MAASWGTNTMLSRGHSECIGLSSASASVLLFCCALHGLDHAYNGLQRFPEPKQGDKQDKEDEQHRPAGA